MEARRLFPGRRVFVLGVDGYFRLDGALRAAQYPVWLPPTDHTRNPASQYSHPQLYDSPTNRQQQNNCVALYLIEEFQRPVETWNLSLESAYTPVWPLHPAVSSQAFGMIDRRGPAVIVDGTGNYPACELTVWESQPVGLMERYIWGVRREYPHLAIFVRAVSPEVLAPQLPADVQIGGAGANIADNCRFSRVDTIYLPPTSE